MTALLELRDVAKHFGGVKAVDGVTATVEVGESVAVVGPNGAGKTSLFNLIAGAEAPTRGTIAYRGVDVTAEPAHRRARIGVLRTFQQLGLMPRETVLDNVLAKLHVRSGYGPADPVLRPWRVRRCERVLRERAVEWLEVVGLANRLDSPVQELSFGLARRVEVAATLAGEPDLLLLDEPTAGLSTAAAHDLLQLLLGIRERGDRTILLIGHDLGFVLPMAERVIAMDRGRVIAEGTPEAIRTDPVVAEAYLGTASGGGTRPGVVPPPAPAEPPSYDGYGLAVGGVHAGYALAPVLQGASLTVRPGELAAIVGRNGAGKSTLLKAIHGQLRVEQGWVLWDGRRLEGRPTAERVRLGIAHVPQDRQLFPDFTVRENLEIGARAAKVEPARAATLLDQVLTTFPRLEERLDQAAGSMSGGEQQMLAMGRGMMGDPRLILLDEISQGLSPKMAGEVKDALVRIKALGIGILAIEHRPWLLEGVADTIHLLEHGVIAWSGPLHEAVRRRLLVDVHFGAGDAASGDRAASEAGS